MACKGCSQVGDCACLVVGAGSITVTGSGSAGDPFEVDFDEEAWLDTVTTASPDLCTEDWTFLARRNSDGLVRRIPATGRCAVIL